MCDIDLVLVCLRMQICRDLALLKYLMFYDFLESQQFSEVLILGNFNFSGLSGYNFRFEESLLDH